MNMNVDSVAGYIDTAHNRKMENESKVIQNGFNSELQEENSCDAQFIQKSQALDRSKFCPVGPQKAVLLYPFSIKEKCF